MRSSSGLTSDEAVDRAGFNPVRASLRPLWEGAPQPTCVAGLAFLLRPLARLGFPAFLAGAAPELTPEGYRLLKVNGKPVLVRGGGWAPDMMLRVDESRREAEFRYVKEMGLNTIRLEGKLEDESFMDRADRDGILIMAGWCCCDAWEKWGKWSEETKQVSVSSLRDQMLRLRSHPSLLMWLNGSDNPPPHDREMAYLDVEKETNWNKPVISSATAKDTDVTGKTGVKMSGPYEYVPANYWTIDTKNGGAYGFNTETSPGPAVPPLEELKTFIPEDKLWPMNDFWNFHSGGGQFKTIGIYSAALEKRYGEPKSAADFAWKSQAMSYEGQRAMFEAYGRNKYKSTGVIQWMLNNAWPGLIWHLYSYDLRAAGGYFGSKKALEPLHVQYSPDDRTVVVVNGTQAAHNGLKVVAKVYDLTMAQKFSRDASLDVAADGVARLFAIPEPDGISSTYLLSLQLLSSTGQLVSRNFYWLSSKPDVLNFDKTEWYYTPQSDFADFTSLQTLPAATVKATWKSLPGTDHDNVEDTLRGGVPHAQSERHLLVAGVGQYLPVVADHDRERASGALDLVQQCPALGGVRGIEGEGKTAALQQVPDLS
jgi:exo-1,4-beta-D-glucosaminidase